MSLGQHGCGIHVVKTRAARPPHGRPDPARERQPAPSGTGHIGFSHHDCLGTRSRQGRRGALSYRSRAAERGTTPAWPSYFLKPSSTIAASGNPVARPPGCELLAFEGEVALVIGRRACRVSPADGWDHVAWITAANDFGVHDLRYADRGANVRSKGVDGFTPLGPRLVDARTVDLATVRLRTWVNGDAGPGRLAGQGHAVRLRQHRRRPVPADHPGARRRHPDRHARRGDRGESRRRGGGRGHRGGAVLGNTAQPHRRGGLPPRPARRHAPGRRRHARGGLRPPGAPDTARRISSPGCARCPPPRWPRCCASAA